MYSITNNAEITAQNYYAGRSNSILKVTQFAFISLLTKEISGFYSVYTLVRKYDVIGFL